jgi:uncharacterized protein (DUF433 family)
MFLVLYQLTDAGGIVRGAAPLEKSSPCRFQDSPWRALHIGGTRIPVSMILGSLADGMTVQEILQEYPQLSEQDIRAALEYAAEVIHHEVIIPLATQGKA